MILITAFEPFDKRITNESLKVVNQLSLTCEKYILPVDISKLEDVLYKKDFSKYDFVVMLGEADRDYISLEKFAYNLLDMRIADNAGYQVKEAPLIAGGQTFATALDLSQFTDGIEVKESIDPGRYLCNMAYYLVSRKTNKVIFIHVSNSDKKDQSKKVETIINEIKQASNPW